jgi:hypothetical protein
VTAPRDGAGRPPGDPAALARAAAELFEALLASLRRSFAPVVQDQPSITCPRCRATSYHPADIAEGYCGRCHEWTAPRCRDCGRVLQPGIAEEAAQWRTLGDGRYFCRASADALHHPATAPPLSRGLWQQLPAPEWEELHVRELAPAEQLAAAQRYAALHHSADPELAALMGPSVLVTRLSDRTAHRIPQALVDDAPAFGAWLAAGAGP